MALIIELSHPLGGRSVDTTGYWYGFIVHHLVQDETTKADVRSFHAQEIETIGLSSSEDARKKGGFYWPVEHWRQLSAKGEIDKNKVSRGLYVALDEVATAFPLLRNISQVNLLIARKGGVHALMQFGAAPLVTLYRDGKVQVVEIPKEILSGQAAVLSLYGGQPALSSIESPRWSGCAEYASGIDGYLAALSEQETANETRIKQSFTKTTDALEKGQKVELQKADPIEKQPIVVAQPHTSTNLGIVNKKPSSNQTTLDPVKNPTKPRYAIWAGSTAFVAILCVVGLFVLKRSDLPQDSSQPVVVAPTVGLPAPQSQASEPAPVARSPAPASTDTVENIVASIAVPTGNWQVSREDLYKFGFDSQLGLVKQILDASKAADTELFDAGSQQLSAMRPTREWPKDDAGARRKFNEGVERLISVAISTSDDRAMSKSIELSEQFLMTHFGNSTAHLNLSLAHSAANRGKAGLPPAIHSIVFNPDGANSWVALGIALARSGDEAGSTAAFCTALRKVNFSDKTVGFFDRIGRGEDAAYSYPEVIKSIKGTAPMCPRERWARSTSAVK